MNIYFAALLYRHVEYELGSVYALKANTISCIMFFYLSVLLAQFWSRDF